MPSGCRGSDPLGAAGLGNLDFRRLNTKGDWCKAYEAACSWMVHVFFFRKRAPFLEIDGMIDEKDIN